MNFLQRLKNGFFARVFKKHKEGTRPLSEEELRRVNRKFLQQVALEIKLVRAKINKQEDAYIPVKNHSGVGLQITGSGTGHGIQITGLNAKTFKKLITLACRLCNLEKKLNAGNNNANKN